MQIEPRQGTEPGIMSTPDWVLGWAGLGGLGQERRKEFSRGWGVVVNGFLQKGPNCTDQSPYSNTLYIYIFPPTGHTLASSPIS